MSRIGIAVWNFAGDNLDKITTFADTGYAAISINGRFFDEPSESDHDAVRRVAEERDLLVTVHGGFHGPDKQTIDEAQTITRTRRVLEWQEETGRVAALTFDAPKIMVEGIRRVDAKTVSSILGKVLSLTAGSGMKVGMEDFPLNESDLALLPDWPSEFSHYGMLVDLGHMNMRLRKNREYEGPAGVEDYLRALPVPIIELHIHSNGGARDEHAPPYAGNADIPTAARILKAMEFQGISTIEVVPAWCGLSSEEALPAAKKSLEYWKGLCSE